jgi:ATP-dependent Lon protease
VADNSDSGNLERGDVVVGVLPVSGIVVFPHLVAPVSVGEDPSARLVDDALSGDKRMAVVTRVPAGDGGEGAEELYRVGTLCQILKMLRMPDGSIRLLIQGLSRLVTGPVTQTSPYLKARISILEEEEEPQTTEIEALKRNVGELFGRIVAASGQLPEELSVAALNMGHAGRLADFVASNMNVGVPQRQSILETFPIRKRLRLVSNLLQKELQVIELRTKIETETRSELEKTQRDYFLREQLKTIRKELGEEDERARETRELRGKIEAAGMPSHASEAAERELERLSSMPPGMAEYTVSRTYLDWLCSLPWAVSTKDKLDCRRATRILDKDHYDLEKVKERIIEYLAVLQLTHSAKGPILCFVGPPGTGKTSLGKSIARALGRKFVRMSLGGIRDEAEIRGHRRTYVGALPGRIIQGIRRAGSHNPVFMLDEIDKVGADFRGDPSAALLEVLDPEQNSTFQDNYLEVTFDLSKVMFITTANVLFTIPPALLDRMEVLELPGYTEEEKLTIARRYLIPRQLVQSGLSSRLLRFRGSAVRDVIRGYTREAGLRNLERELANVCRKVAKEVAEGFAGVRVIGVGAVERYLGPPRYLAEAGVDEDEVGVATGLAWTPEGGEILFVEASRMPGGKTLNLTGQLGDVMKESAQAALSYLRSRARRLGISEDFFETSDIHLHVPSGAIPKDGPSAGVAIVASLASLLSGRPVRHEVAMTGEITLRGKVLPVGGIRQKVMAASRAHLRTVLLPRQNAKDLAEVPEEIRTQLEFLFVDTVDDVLRTALTDGEPQKRNRRTKKARRSAGSG